MKWERKGNGTRETQAHAGKFRMRVWMQCYGCNRSYKEMCTDVPGWQRWNWAIEGHECRVIASGGAPTIGRAKAMAEACAKAAIKAGLR